jgi:hypothetical protein
MQDRGDKIVTLAREILRSDELPALPQEETNTTKITLSFKMLCLATMLSAAGSSAITGLVIETRRPLNHYEKTELDALVFYAARQNGLDEDHLRHEVLAMLKLSSFEAMTERDFMAARNFLHDKAQ